MFDDRYKCQFQTLDPEQICDCNEGTEEKHNKI